MPIESSVSWILGGAALRKFVAQLSESAEFAAGLVEIAFAAGHGHEAVDFEGRERGDFWEGRFDLVWPETVFGGIAGDVDFKQDGDAKLGHFGGAIDCFENSQ